VDTKVDSGDWLMARSVLFLTTAEMGAGKTYCRGPVFLVEEWLPFNKGLHISNLPLHSDRIAEYCQGRYKTDHDAERRIRRIPDEILREWIRPESVAGPWDLFGSEEWPLAGSHICLDEAHLMIPRTKSVERRRKWNSWIAEIRHAGATIEFISQDIDRMDEDIRKVCGLRVVLVSRLTDRDPWLKIPMSDWYELKALITREWNPCVIQIEKRKSDRRWETVHRKRIELNSTMYRLYDSFSKPHAVMGIEGEDVGDTVSEHEFQRRSALGVVWWFFRRNGWRFLGGLGVLAVGVWFFFLGGLPWALGSFQNLIPVGPGGVAKAAVVEVEGGTVGEVGEGEDIGTGVAVDTSLVDLDFEGGGVAPWLTPETVLFRYAHEDGSFEDYTVDDFGYLVYGVEEVEARAEKAESELSVLQSLEGGIVGMGEDWVLLENGERVELRGKVRGTTFGGKTIVRIDFSERRCLFNDGTVAFVRVSDGKKSGSDFIGRAFSAGGSGESAKHERGDRSKGGRASGDRGGVRDAAGIISSGAGETDR